MQADRRACTGNGRNARVAAGAAGEPAETGPEGPTAWKEGTGMVRMNKEAAEQLLKGRTPREIYDIVRAQVEKAPDAKFQDLFETLDWVVAQGYATAAELEAVEEEGN